MLDGRELTQQSRNYIALFIFRLTNLRVHRLTWVWSTAAKLLMCRRDTMANKCLTSSEQIGSSSKTTCNEVARAPIAGGALLGRESLDGLAEVSLIDSRTEECASEDLRSA